MSFVMENTSRDNPTSYGTLETTISLKEFNSLIANTTNSFGLLAQLQRFDNLGLKVKGLCMSNVAYGEFIRALITYKYADMVYNQPENIISFELNQPLKAYFGYPIYIIQEYVSYDDEIESLPFIFNISVEINDLNILVKNLNMLQEEINSKISPILPF